MKNQKAVRIRNDPPVSDGRGQRLTGGIHSAGQGTAVPDALTQKYGQWLIPMEKRR